MSLSQTKKHIRVLLPSGRRASTICEQTAIRLVDAGLARIIGKGRSVRAVQLTEISRWPRMRPYSDRLGDRSTPAGAWRLRRICDEEALLIVAALLQCLGHHHHHRAKPTTKTLRHPLVPVVCDAG